MLQHSPQKELGRSLIVFILAREETCESAADVTDVTALLWLHLLALLAVDLRAVLAAAMALLLALGFSLTMLDSSLDTLFIATNWFLIRYEITRELSNTYIIEPTLVSLVSRQIERWRVWSLAFPGVVRSGWDGILISKSTNHSQTMGSCFRDFCRSCSETQCLR